MPRLDDADGRLDLLLGDFDTPRELRFLGDFDTPRELRLLGDTPRELRLLGDFETPRELRLGDAERPEPDLRLGDVLLTRRLGVAIVTFIIYVFRIYFFTIQL